MSKPCWWCLLGVLILGVAAIAALPVRPNTAPTDFMQQLTPTLLLAALAVAAGYAGRPKPRRGPDNRQQGAPAALDMPVAAPPGDTADHTGRAWTGDPWTSEPRTHGAVIAMTPWPGSGGSRVSKRRHRMRRR